MEEPPSFRSFLLFFHPPFFALSSWSLENVCKSPVWGGGGVRGSRLRSLYAAVRCSATRPLRKISAKQALASIAPYRSAVTTTRMHRGFLDCVPDAVLACSQLPSWPSPSGALSPGWPSRIACVYTAANRIQRPTPPPPNTRLPAVG